VLKVRPPRKCDAAGCIKPARGGISPTSYCQTHGSRLWLYGDARQSHTLKLTDIKYVLPLAQEYLRRYPPPPDVLAKLAEIVSPTATYAVQDYTKWHGRAWRGKKGQREARYRLGRMMKWWRSPESAYNFGNSSYGLPQRAKRMLPLPPEFVLRVLLAAETYIEERPAEFKGKAPELMRAHILLRCRRHPPEHPAWEWCSRLARDLLAQIIAEQIGVYLLRAARHVVEQLPELRRKVAARVNTGNGGPRMSKARLERIAAMRPPKIIELIVNPEPVTAEIRARMIAEEFNRT
jgi:hypothetical protein